MILIEKPKLQFLLNGRVITVQSRHDRFRKGRSYAAGLTRRAELCRVQVLSAAPADGGFELKIRRVQEEDPRLLAARPGPGRDYVTDPHLAMRGEPEAVSAEALNRFVAEGLAGHARRNLVEMRRRHVRAATLRIREAERREDWEAYRRAIADLQAVDRLNGTAA